MTTFTDTKEKVAIEREASASHDIELSCWVCGEIAEDARLICASCRRDFDKDDSSI